MALLVHRRTGSVVNVPDDKADSVALRTLGFEAGDKPAKRTTAKKAPRETAIKTATKKAAAKKSTK